MSKSIRSNVKISKKQALIVSAVVAVVGVVFLIAAHAAADNLVSNGSFENPLGDTTCYHGTGNVGLWQICTEGKGIAQRFKSGDADNGKYVMQVKIPNGRLNYAYAVQTIAVVPGCYSFSARYRYISGAAAGFSIHWEGDENWPEKPTSTQDSQWHTLAFDALPVPTGVQHANVVLDGPTNDGIASNVNWDSVQASKVSCPQ